MNGFKIIAITPEEISSQEREAVCLMLGSGKVDRVHIRHKSATPAELCRLLSAIPANLLPRISVHLPYPVPEISGDKKYRPLFQLFKESSIGLHLPSSATPSDICLARSKGIAGVSVSCHSLEELMAKKSEADYCFLSPIYDSISKPGYLSVFSPAELAEARDRGLIDSKVIALGGITPDKAPQLMALGFGGAAMLGFFSDRGAGLSQLRKNLATI